MTDQLRLGIDLGGTKIEIIALDPSGQTLYRERVATPAGDYHGTIAAIVQLVARAERQSRPNRPLQSPARIGVGMPGALSRRTGLVKNANSTVLNGKPFKQDLEAALAREIRVENDANCFAVSEAIDGAGNGFETVFGVILGTGVGGGLVIARKLVRGAASIAGEWGHLPLPPITQLARLSDRQRQLAQAEQPDCFAGVAPGVGSTVPLCYCGRRGCIEAWVSGPALAADYRRERRLVAASQAASQAALGHELGAELDGEIDAAAIVRRAAAGEALAALVWDRYIDRLARGLAQVINLVDPDAIVLGGGVSKAAGLADRLQAALAPYVFSDEVATRVMVNQHGDSSGVRGAAWL